MTSNIVLSTRDYTVIGTRPIRHDGTDKVTGRARYAADTYLPGLLHAKILRSPRPHARVVTSADFPESSARLADQEEGALVNYGFYSRNVMAREKALYRGHAVAAVVATNVHVAEQALALIDVEYDVLSPVLNAYDAMKEDAPSSTRGC